MQLLTRCDQSFSNAVLLERWLCAGTGPSCERLAKAKSPAGSRPKILGEFDPPWKGAGPRLTIGRDRRAG